jgi:hypothetical protein
MPFWSVYIDYNGAVMPCCNLRSDVPSHASYVQGHLGEPSDDIFSVYVGQKAANFRKSLLNNKVKDGVCRSCNFALENMTPENLLKMETIMKA